MKAALAYAADLAQERVVPLPAGAVAVRCKIDENLPVEAADLLSGGAHECQTVFDEQLAGADDASLYERCCREGRVLLTLDLDFADIRA